MGQSWMQRELEDALDRFATELAAANLQPRAIAAYLDRARRFVRWRAQGASERADAEQLTAGLDDFEASLAGKAPSTIASYVDGADRFVSWLAGEYRPRAVRPPAAAPPPQAKGPATPRVPNGVKPVEDEVIDAVVQALKGDGWRITATRTAASREHGADIEARKGERRLLVEAKGWPAATYVAGNKKGQPKAYLPYTQGRAYFSNALLPALLQWSEYHAEIALAFPEQRTYRTLVDRATPAFRHLGIGVYFVELADPPAVVRHLDHRRSDT